MNKPGKFQRGIINSHIFISICFQGGPIALNLPLAFVVQRCFLRRFLEFYEQTAVFNVVVTVTLL